MTTSQLKLKLSIFDVTSINQSSFWQHLVDPWLQTYAKLEKVNDDTNWYLMINSVLQYMPYHLAAKIKSPFQECHDVIIIAFSFCIRLLEWKLRLTTEIKKKFLFFLIRDVSYNFPSALITIGLKKYKVKVFLRATTSLKKITEHFLAYISF